MNILFVPKQRTYDKMKSENHAIPYRAHAVMLSLRRGKEYQKAMYSICHRRRVRTISTFVEISHFYFANREFVSFFMLFLCFSKNGQLFLCV